MEKRLGIEEKADTKQIDVVGQLMITVLTWKTPVKVAKHYISTAVVVEDRISEKLPFIEFYPGMLSQSQIKGAINKFKADPTSFNNQK